MTKKDKNIKSFTVSIPSIDKLLPRKNKLVKMKTKRKCR